MGARRITCGSELARESGAAVCQADRVIVLREQARLPQGSRGFSWTASSFFAGKLAPTGGDLLERGLPANQALRCVRQTASSFFASKLGSHRDRGVSVGPRHRSSRASSAPTGIAGFQLDRVIVLRGQASLQRGSDFQCWSGACPRWRLTRISGQSRPALSRASLAPTYLLSVGVRLARESGAAVRQADHVIVLREQVRFLHGYARQIPC